MASREYTSPVVPPDVRVLLRRVGAEQGLLRGVERARRGLATPKPSSDDGATGTDGCTQAMYYHIVWGWMCAALSVHSSYRTYYGRRSPGYIDWEGLGLRRRAEPATQQFGQFTGVGQGSIEDAMLNHRKQRMVNAP